MHILFPLVSVIMPIRNEVKAIERSLERLVNQDYPRDKLEIIVADGMSDDATREIVKRLTAQDSRIRLIDNHERIMATGFNAGLGQVRGDIIVMLGGHTEIATDYIKRCVQALQHSDAGCVGGVIKTICQTEDAKAIALAMSSPFGVGGVAFRTGASKPMYVDTVAFGAYKREVFNRAGGLDEELIRNQDDEFNYRLRKMGIKILLDPTIHASYYSRSSWQLLWRQYYQYGYWKVRVMQKHPRQMRWRHFVPAAFVAALTVTALGAPLSRFALWSLAAVLGTYLLTVLCASCSIAGANKKTGDGRFLARLAICFATLHFSYGIGCWVGLVKFWNRWGISGVQAAQPRSLPY